MNEEKQNKKNFHIYHNHFYVSYNNKKIIETFLKQNLFNIVYNFI